MAERRMISKAIIDSDAFLDMPASSQNLYFHLNIRADDEGFIDGPKKIMRAIGANQNDLELLLNKRYVLCFESGVIVIKHWKLHNLIRKDRSKETLYTEEKQILYQKGDGSYTDHPPTNDNQVTTKCPRSIGEYSIVKESIEKGREEKRGKRASRFSPPTIDEVSSYCLERSNKVDASRFVDFYASKNWMIGKNKMKDWKAAVRNWERSDKSKPVDQYNLGTGRAIAGFGDE